MLRLRKGDGPKILDARIYKIYSKHCKKIFLYATCSKPDKNSNTIEKTTMKYT